MKLNNGKSIGYTGGGILKATSNGLRQQSIAHGAEIKVSCISNMLPSVLLCRTPKPNGKLFMGSTKTERIEHLTWICDQLCTVFSEKIIGNVTAKNYLKESLCRLFCASLFKEKVLHGNGLILKFSLLQYCAYLTRI